MSKGDTDFGVVAIKSKGGDCWHYDACVVLDGNPLIEEHLTYIQSDESTKEINKENMAYRSQRRGENGADRPRGADGARGAKKSKEEEHTQLSRAYQSKRGIHICKEVF